MADGDSSTVLRKIYSSSEGGIREITIIGLISDVFNDDVDVNVRLDDGSLYVPTFITIENVKQKMIANQSDGECRSGRYFWTCDMVIIRDLRDETILEAVLDLVETKHIFLASKRYGD